MLASVIDHCFLCVLVRFVINAITLPNFITPHSSVAFATERETSLSALDHCVPGQPIITMERILWGAVAE